MPTLERERLAVSLSDDGREVTLRDRRRDALWRLDPARSGFQREGEAILHPFGAGAVRREGEALIVERPLPEGPSRQRWTLEADHLKVELLAGPPGVAGVSLPGPFMPDAGACEMALPLYQGVLLRRPPDLIEQRAQPGGHGQFAMDMGALIGERASLVVAEESPANWTAHYGVEQGRPYFSFRANPCPAEGWQPQTVRVFPTAPSLPAVCKRYRAYLKARGDFVSWPEKIERKPILRRLFGALIAFTGYNADPSLDYAAEAGRLKACGFDSLLLYPLRMCQYSLGFQMGGDDPVWLSDDEIASVRRIEGALAAPWGWVFEGLDDGTPVRRALYRHDADGRPMAGWRIDAYQWYLVCPPYQREHIMRRFAGDMQAMDWIHFDVNASYPPTPCFNRQHHLHGDRPMGRAADVEWVRRLVSAETVGNRIVSSEGFVGHFASAYDIGTTKMLPGADTFHAVPVPMTMLVFHDACVHDWWELHNYNAQEGWPISGALHGWGRVGSGLPRLKAALDALCGCPPNVFPFGRQYAWIDIAARKSVSYTVHLEDEAVREAIREALPVARLHGRVGMLEMADFAFLSEDRSVQQTRFTNGTRVVANLGETAREVEGLGLLPAHSWREI